MATVSVVIPPELSEPFAAWCKQRKLTTSQGTRVAIAKLLQVAVPVVAEGRRPRIISSGKVKYKKRKGEPK